MDTMLFLKTVVSFYSYMHRFYYLEIQLEYLILTTLVALHAIV
jgi:hypothetical protein